MVVKKNKMAFIDDSLKYRREKAYLDLQRRTKPLWDKFHRIKKEFDDTWRPMHGAYSDCYWRACGVAWEELEAKRKPLLDKYDQKMRELR